MIKQGLIMAFRSGNGVTCPYRICESELERLAMLNMDSIIDSIVERKIQERKDG